MGPAHPVMCPLGKHWASFKAQRGSIKAWGLLKEVGPADLQEALISFPLKGMPKSWLRFISLDTFWVKCSSALTHVNGSLTSLVPPSSWPSFWSIPHHSRQKHHSLSDTSQILLPWPSKPTWFGPSPPSSCPFAHLTRAHLIQPRRPSSCPGTFPRSPMPSHWRLAPSCSRLWSQLMSPPQRRDADGRA